MSPHPGSDARLQTFPPDPAPGSVCAALGLCYGTTEDVAVIHSCLTSLTSFAAAMISNLSARVFRTRLICLMKSVTR